MRNGVCGSEEILFFEKNQLRNAGQGLSSQQKQQGFCTFLSFVLKPKRLRVSFSGRNSLGKGLPPLRTCATAPSDQPPRRTLYSVHSVVGDTKLKLLPAAALDSSLFSSLLANRETLFLSSATNETGRRRLCQTGRRSLPDAAPAVASDSSSA